MNVIMGLTTVVYHGLVNTFSSAQIQISITICANNLAEHYIHSTCHAKYSNIFHRHLFLIEDSFVTLYLNSFAILCDVNVISNQIEQ